MQIAPLYGGVEKFKEKTMANKKFWLGMLVIALVFGMAVVGCDNGTTGGESDTWSNVTNFSQVNGTWKAQSSASVREQGITVTFKYNNYTITLNATAKTMSFSGSETVTYSGGNISSYWPDIKESMSEAGTDGVMTVSVNDTNHSITTTTNNLSFTLTDEVLTELGYQINQNGTKLKYDTELGFEIIFTKQ
jgi:hypothetical protein